VNAEKIGCLGEEADRWVVILPLSSDEAERRIDIPGQPRPAKNTPTEIYAVMPNRIAVIPGMVRISYTPSSLADCSQTRSAVSEYDIDHIGAIDFWSPGKPSCEPARCTPQRWTIRGCRPPKTIALS
jgi:hypothetical protein